MSRAVVHRADGQIAGIELRPSATISRALRRDAATLVLPARHILAPAYVDVHCHGAGGGSAHGDTASLTRMATTLLAHGVGGFLAATITAPMADLERVARRVARLIEQGPSAHRPTAVPTLLGLHLEGPALAPQRSAGHDPAALQTPAALARALARAPQSWRSVRLVTLAPELDGGMELTARLAAAGVVASIGHTDASFEVAMAGYAAGARSTTHLFSGMPPLHHREPGPIGAALAAAPFVELICDGIHIRSELLPSLVRAIGDERLVLVSDALPLAGSRLRRIEVPGATVRVRAGRAVNPDGSLAGSRLLLDGMVERAVRAGVPISVALRGATENPARLLGLHDRGVLAPGARADLVVVTRGGRLRQVLPSGTAP